MFSAGALGTLESDGGTAEKQIPEDAGHLITVWNERQAKRMAVAGAVFDRAGSQLERRRMSERRSIPPMQYAPPEDGHANHG